MFHPQSTLCHFIWGNDRLQEASFIPGTGSLSGHSVPDVNQQDLVMADRFCERLDASELPDSLVSSGWHVGDAP